MTMHGFWRQTRIENRRVLLGDYGSINNVHYLFPQGGGPSGSYATFTDLKPNLRSRDLILLSGVLREQAVMPTDVYDITIVGAANRPRQATDGGVPTGGGATWMAPASGASATTPLIEIVRQGITFENILFNPHTSSAAVRITTTGGLNEGGQFTFRNCSVLGGGSGQIGIEDNGGSGFVVIEDSEFILLTGTAILGLSTSNAVPQGWRIENNVFRQNTNDIKMSLNYAQILKNRFMTAGNGAVNKVISTVALAGQGEKNHVILNQFSNPVAEIVAAEGFSGAADDVWANYVTDQAALVVGQPTP